MPSKLNLLVVRGDAGVQGGATHGLPPASPLAKSGLPGFETGLDGHFALTLLWPGKYRIRFAPKVGEQVDFEKTYCYPQVIEISEGPHVDDIVFVAGDASQ